MLAELTKEQQLPAGFTVRPATMDDLETAVSLMNACSQNQFGQDEHNVADVKTEWSQEKFNLETNTRLVFSPDGQLAGYLEVWDTHAVPVHPWVWARVHPQFEGLGIGTYLLQVAEERVMLAVDRIPADTQLSMRCGCPSNHEPSKQLLTDFGMASIRHFWTMLIDMEAQPDFPKFPEGITIKTLADIQDLPKVARATDEAFRDHWGYVEQPEEEMLKDWREWVEKDPKHDDTLFFLAMDGDEIAGVSLCRIESWNNPNWGWVDELAVRRPWRRRGIALALLHHSFAEMYQRGKKHVGLGVDAQSLTGATRLYEKAGMHVFREFENFEKVLRSGQDLATQTVQA
jgi:ribosomal protein S18 acetylase RimI-like enzyme